MAPKAGGQLKVVCVVQARMGSERLPGKALAPIAGKPLLLHVLERARAIAGVDQVILATGSGPENLPLLRLAWAQEIYAFVGSEGDVLGRVYAAADRNAADVVVRVTGDCPLLDPFGSAEVLRYFLAGTFDYVSNVEDGTDGLDTEVIGMSALFHARQRAKDPADREHVTRYIRARPDEFRIGLYVAGHTVNDEKWSVDSQEDLERVRLVFEREAAA